VTPRQNLILITVDSLRADVVGPDLTPALHGLAAESLVFSNAIAPGCYTMMSMPALFAGTAPSRLTPYYFGEEHGVLLGARASVTEVLAETGYHTGGFHSNPYLSRAFGFDRGFRDFDDDMVLGGSRRRIALHMLAYRLRRVFRSRPYLPAGPLNRKALAWLARARRPFFLWLHYMDTHGPYQSDVRFHLPTRIRDEALWRKAIGGRTALSPGERARFFQSYRRAAANLDRALGDFLGALRQNGVLAETAILVTADHGEEFFEHGRFGHSNGPYEELIRVPLILRVPALPARTIDSQVSLLDVAPTIVELAAAPARPQFEGRSLLRFTRNGVAVTPSVTITEQTLTPYVAAVRGGEWKLIQGGGGRTELYHLVQDPGETRNVAAERPEIAERLAKELQAHTGSPEAPTSLSPEEEEVVARRLRDLGYL
jgi:arylsulfatase